MKTDPQSLIETVFSTLSALVPGMVGAAVGQLWKPGLTWSQRLAQWVAGVSCQYYVSKLLVHGLGWHDFVAQAVGFFVAMWAFDLAPRLLKALSDFAGALPDLAKTAITDLIGRFKLPGGN